MAARGRFITALAVCLLTAVPGAPPAAGQANDATAEEDTSTGGGAYGGMTVFGSSGVGVAAAFVLGGYVSAERSSAEWQVVNGSVLLARWEGQLAALALRIGSDINFVSGSGGYFGFGAGLQSLFSTPRAMLAAHIGLLPANGEGLRAESRYEAWLGDDGGAVHVFFVSVGVHRGLAR